MSEVRGSPPNKKTAFGGLLFHTKNKSPSKPVSSLEGFLLPANSNFRLHISYNSRGVSSLLTVWWFSLRNYTSAFSGYRGQIENAFYHKARCRAVYWSRAAYDPYLSFLMIMPDEAGQALGFFTCSWMLSAAWWQRSKKGLAPSLYGTIIRSYIENEGGAACWSIENLGMLASLFQNWMSRNTQHFLWIFKGQSFYH